MRIDKKFTVFIPRIDGTVWMGGKQYFDNLSNLVKFYYPNVTFCETIFNHDVFYPEKNNLKSRVQRKISGSNYLDEYKKNIRDYYQKIAGDSIPILFTNAVIKETGGIPYIIWIADFQFMHLKEHATPAHLKAGEDNARNGTSMADAVMLSSKDALNDFSHLLPEYIGKANVVSFAKRIEPSMLRQDSTAVKQKYNLPDSFFYVSNQFWKHKNHLVVIDALKILKQKGLKFTVVFSGHTHDFRNPLYFDGLLSHIAEQGVHEHVHILGMIPFSDVVSLIRESVAVINPSKFEGWNTAVEEVKSIGKAMLLSDLAVHREQAENDADYFNPDQPEQLAERMIDALAKKRTKSRKEDEKEASEKYQIAEKNFADNYYKLIESIANKYQK